MESVVFTNRPQYYQALRSSQRDNDATAFIEFSLGAILDAIEEVLLTYGDIQVGADVGVAEKASVMNLPKGTRSTRCYHVPMALPHDISQRDLRTRSKEIMDAVEHGQAFTVTRDGRQIAELIPLRRRRTFVPADELVTLGRGLPAIDPRTFRADLDEVADPYDRDVFG
jgi:prevent-host-death family protein